MPLNPGALGGGPYGPGGFGAGGPLTVVRALAVAGQVIRLTFSEEPVFRSPAGSWDAKNPSNYILTVVGGQATAPIPVGVLPALVVGPTYGVGNGSGAAAERGVDVQVDRQLMVGVTYRIRAQLVRSLAGGDLGSPDFGDFLGVTRLEAVRLPERRLELVDLANPPVLGHWTVTGGDLSPEDPALGLKKRILRRWMTPLGAFRHLPRYGLKVRLKGVAYPAQLAALQADAQGQVLEEPDVRAAAVRVSMSAAGLLFLECDVRPKRGVPFTFGQKFLDGTAVV